MRVALAALAMAVAGAARAADGDVQYYIDRPDERRALLQACQGDAALLATRECQNANAAGAVDLMTPRARKAGEGRKPSPLPGPPPPAAPRRSNARGPLRAT